MPNYTTSSGFPELVGSMVVTNNNVDSYYSNSLGVFGSVQNIGGPNLRFKVSFGTGRPYNINANVSGSGYSGTANNDSPTAAQETWSATASTVDKADASDRANGTDDEAVTKSAAS